MESAPVGAWLDQLQKAMDVLDARHQAIASNIANVNTPAFQRLDLNFKEEMARQLGEGAGSAGAALQVTTEGMMRDTSSPDAIAPRVDTSSPARQDGNNVNLEREMVNLSETGEVYSALSRVAVKNIKMMRYVISGGRG